MYIFSDNNLRMFASCQLSRSGAMKTEISPPKYKTYCGAHVCTETGGNGGVLPNKCEQDEKRKEFKNIFFRETAWEKHGRWPHCLFRLTLVHKRAAGRDVLCKNHTTAIT